MIIFPTVARMRICIRSWNLGLPSTRGTPKINEKFTH